MTCIVGVYNKDRTEWVIGADSAASDMSCIYPRIDTKLFVNGALTFAGTGSYRAPTLVFTPLRKSVTPFFDADPATVFSWGLTNKMK